MLPLATDPDMFYLGEGDEKLDGIIIYVDSPGFGNEERCFSGLDKNHTAIDFVNILKKNYSLKERYPQYMKFMRQ